MRLFPKPIPVGKYSGFTDDDLFGRKDFGRGIGNLLAQVEDPMTVILDAPWGMGKTTFVKMWCGMMRNHGFPVIYFDAFKHDFIDDAFMALTGEVFAQAQELYAEAEKLKSKGELPEGVESLINKLKQQTPIFLRAAARFGKTFAKEGSKGLVRKFTEKFVGVENTEEISDAANRFLAEAVNEACEKSSGELCDWVDNDFLSDIVVRNEQRKTIEEFQHTLEKLAGELSALTQSMYKDSGQKELFPSDNTPLIFVVDELDRCKPTFALELLEVVKHFFSTPNVHFLVVTHVEQLENSVRYAYGINEQAGSYLQKFYDVKVKLPEQTGLASVSSHYLAKLERELCVQNDILDFSYTRNQRWLAKKMWQFSPRTLEKIFTQVKLLQVTMPAIFLDEFTPVFYLLPILMVEYPKLVEKIIEGGCSVGEIGQALDVDPYQLKLESTYSNTFWATWADVLEDKAFLDDCNFTPRQPGASREAFITICNSLERYR